MIKKGDPLFLDSQGIIHKYNGEELIWPVFIGEVAYKEKKLPWVIRRKKLLVLTINGFMSLKAFKLRNKDSKLMETNKDFLFKR